MNPNAPFYPVTTNTPLNSNPGVVPFTGITIRDYIAIEAMKALISARTTDSGIASQQAFKNGYSLEECTSKIAYKYADALIAQSNKK